jgi:hypothetical protein
MLPFIRAGISLGQIISASSEFAFIAAVIFGESFLEICITFGFSPFRIVFSDFRIPSIVTPSISFILIKTSSANRSISNHC